MTWGCKRLWTLGVACTAGWGSLIGQEVPLSPSEGKLAVRKVLLSGDGGQYERLVFEGPLRFRGESPSGFVVDAAVAGGAALGFRHELVRDSQLLVWIYGSDSVPPDDGVQWDNWLEERMEGLPKQYEAVVEGSFAESSGASPLFGGIPLAAELTIRDSETEARYRQRLLVRHVEAENKVVVLDLFCPEENYSSFREVMRVFGLYLYFPEES